MTGATVGWSERSKESIKGDLLLATAGLCTVVSAHGGGEDFRRVTIQEAHLRRTAAQRTGAKMREKVDFLLNQGPVIATSTETWEDKV